MTGIKSSIAVTVITMVKKQHVVYGVTLKVVVRGVFTRCLAMYGSGVWIGMTVMLIPVICMAIYLRLPVERLVCCAGVRGTLSMIAIFVVLAVAASTQRSVASTTAFVVPGPYNYEI
jgi:hypothetical protein